MPTSCRLCLSPVSLFAEYDRPFKAAYYHCSICDLVQMDEKSLLDSEEEKSHYKMHENSERDPGYVEFLSKCYEPALKYLNQGMKGLDYGCGPYPMLAELMSEMGFEMDYYDPYFFPFKDRLSKTYDFLTATEVVEHFNDPATSWSELVSKVVSGGIISVMTSIRYPDVDFRGWHYRRDATHICFYSPKTMDWIARKFGLAILEFPRNVIVFRKN